MEEIRERNAQRMKAWLAKHPDQEAVHMATLEDMDAYEKRVEEARAKRTEKNHADADPVLRKKYVALREARMERMIKKEEGGEEEEPEEPEPK